MLFGKPPDIPSSEITSREEYFRYLSRRRFLKGAAATAGAAALAANQLLAPRVVQAATKLQTVPSPLTTTGEQLTTLDDITHYNNFYEFGVDKGDPAKNAGGLPTRPWTVKVEGKVAKPLTFDIDDLLKLRPLEDRVYRHRCVEAWSMVIPWVGYSLSEFIKQCNPLPSAKYVQFLSYYNTKVEKWTYEDPGISWPYSEGLRMDEAMNPLTLLTFGLYGETLPNQDGAPVRVVLPWKYGYKSAKSIVTVRFQRVRLLLQRQSQRRPPALESKNRAPHRTAFLRAAPHHAHVQWLHRSGGLSV
jgi:sulfoxide reductase catalytic subunit YedY